MIEMSPLTLQCQLCSGSLGALLSALTQENGSDGRKGCLFNVSPAQMEESRQGIHLQSRLSSQSLGRALKALGRNGESQNTRRKRKPTRIHRDTNRCVCAACPPQNAGSCWGICCISHFFHISTFSSAVQIDFEAFCFGPLVAMDSSKCLSLSLETECASVSSTGNSTDCDLGT